MTTAIRGTRDQIADQIRNEILGGALAAGARLSEAELAARFGVSRGPIRECLSLLSSEGFVICRPNCGASVAPGAPQALRQLILPIRSTLETYALEQIYDSLNSVDWATLEDLVFQMERAARQRDLVSLVRLDVALHRHLVERAEMPDLIGIWQAIVIRMRVHFQQTVEAFDQAGNLDEVRRHHAELVDALRRGPKVQALAALAQHIAAN